MEQAIYITSDITYKAELFLPNASKLSKRISTLHMRQDNSYT